MDFAKLYIDLMLAERQWSWAIVGILYLVLAIFIRILIFRKMIREAKQIDPNLYSTVKGIYLKNSLSGWILYFISFLLVIVMWLGWKSAPQETVSAAILCLFLSLLFFLSIILHLTAFAKALLVVLRQRMGVEKEF